MSKAVKGMVTAQLKDRYGDLDSACVVDITGMTVVDQQALRGMLREKSGRLEVVKNSMARRAMGGGPMEPLGAALIGPCALVTSSESVIDVAKTLVAAAKEFSALTLKEAIIEGDPSLLMVTDLAKMKSRLELIADVAGLLAAPARNVASCLQSPAGKIAGCLKTMADKAA